MHTWSSLACTVFLLLSCVTGLPLIFADEIEAWQQAGQGAAQALPAGSAAHAPTLAAIVGDARRHYPDDRVRFLFLRDDEGTATVVMAPADTPSRAADHWLEFDRRTGRLLDDAPPPARQPWTFMRLVRELHVDLAAGVAGRWLLAAVCALFVLATLSGVALYGPYMRRLAFGTIRAGRPRIRWLDVHNLLGIAALAWVLVMGVTGLLNELADPLSARWRQREIAVALSSNGANAAPVDGAGTVSSAAGAAWPGGPAATAEGAPFVTVEQVWQAVHDAQPGRSVTSIIFPSASFSNPGHYLVWTNGDTHLTARLFTAALVDARTGQLATTVRMPGYLLAMQVSRPLHFGDFGGLPLKLIWAALDGMLIVLLASGAYLWAGRLRRRA